MNLAFFMNLRDLDASEIGESRHTRHVEWASNRFWPFHFRTGTIEGKWMTTLMINRTFWTNFHVIKIYTTFQMFQSDNQLISDNHYNLN